MDKEIETKIIERIVKDEALKKQVVGMDAKAAQAYLIKQGLANVSEKEAGELLEKVKKYLEDGALTDEEMEQVVGGFGANVGHVQINFIRDYMNR